MSTYVSISVAAARSPQVDAAIDAAFAEIARLEALLSEWKPGSEISLVNKASGGDAVAVGDELYQVIKQATQISVDTDGAFDVTFQALWGLWDFKSIAPVVPDDKSIAARVALVDYRQVRLDDGKRSVALGKTGMKIGLGGIAKGYIVDRASHILSLKGFTNHLVNAGGDLYASGTRGDRKWRIGVRNPQDKSLYATIEVQDQGLATSGNYERFFVKDGVRYHHILDPGTGRPARGVSSSTVLAPSAMLADAWATASFVLGVQKALAKAPAHRLEMLMFDDEFGIHSTPGMKSLVQPLAQETQPDNASPPHDHPSHP